MKRPVFVVGCPRSGTTLLYSMLIASGGFAVYRKETYFYDLVYRFPNLTERKWQEEFAREFLAGYLGKVPGLDVAPFVSAALERCRTTMDFLPLLMTAITEAQGMDRWVEATPVHVLHMEEIRRAVPDALFVHVIRDGRDCAISNAAQGWVPPLPFDAKRSTAVAALFWEWLVRKGRSFGRMHPGLYMEVPFERLIADPQTILETVGRFIDHDLDYACILRNPVHSMKRPNTSFRDERDSEHFDPVERWRKSPHADLRLCEALVGQTLQELGYELAHPHEDGSGVRVRAAIMRKLYPPFFELKQRIKCGTPVGRRMISARIWAEQPRAGEAPVQPVPSHGRTAHVAHRKMVTS